MKLADQNRFDKSLRIFPLSDEANSVIAAFSLETRMQFKKGEIDSTFMSNGLPVSLSKNYLGYTQVVVESGGEERTVAITESNVSDLAPNTPYIKVFKDMKHQSVLSMYKAL